MEPLRIIQVIPDLRRGGAERLLTDICGELAARKDVAVKLVTLRSDNSFRDVTQQLDWTVTNSSVQLSVWRRNRVDLGSWQGLLRSFRPHIIHSHLYEAEVLTRERVHSGIKYFSHFHDNMPVFGPFSLSTFFEKREMARLYEKLRLVRKYRVCNNSFICISGDTYQYAQAALGKGFRYHLLHNAIRFERFYTGPGRQFPGTNEIRLLNIGSLVDKKNQVFLLDVAAELLKKGLQLKLTLLGDGPNRQQLQQAITDRGLGKHIDMPGESGQVEKYIRDADLYLHAATYEPFGLVLLEAMAGGLPVVSLNGRGNKDVVINGENGYLLDKQDPVQFAEAVIRSLSTKERYEQLSTNAVTFARGFDIATYVDKLLEIYQS